jgi:CDGSH-type Zn-finger protein
MGGERWQARSSTGEVVELEPCGDGPVLARHADVVVDSEGVEHQVTRPVVALCTCGKSQRRPWCDSTHKSVRRT